MISQRILSTIKFFDLQDYPLTLLEMRQFLLADLSSLSLDQQAEVIDLKDHRQLEAVSAGDILSCINTELLGQTQSYQGLYFLTGRQAIADARLKNYFFGIQREKEIKKYIKFLKYIPFVRGVALAGSQAMGQEKETSDIDLLIITAKNFMWLPRTLVTIYFQIIGKRRHGKKIKNRFCLNHYLAGAKKITQLRNFYTAHEYLKLRPLVYPHGVWEFQNQNQWINYIFPNADLSEPEIDRESRVQKKLEKLCSGNLGFKLEALLKNWQLPKIRQEKFILVSDDELSFHPESKQEGLLKEFLLRN